MYAKRMQKGIAHWDKQEYAIPAPNCVLRVWEEITEMKILRLSHYTLVYTSNTKPYGCDAIQVCT